MRVTKTEERLPIAKRLIAIGEAGDSKRESFKAAAKEIIAYKEETDATWKVIAEALGRDKGYVLKIVQWAKEGHKANTPHAGKEESERVARAHTKRVLAEAPLEEVEKIVAALPAKRVAKLAQASLARPGVTREIAKDAEASATVTRASGKVAEEMVHTAKKHSRTETTDTLGVLVEVIGNLLGAKRKLRDSYTAARDMTLDTEQREAVQEQLDELVTIVDWYRSYLNSGDQSFEDELSKLLSTN